MLLHSVEDDNLETRKAGIETLRYLNRAVPEAVEALRGALGDGDPEVRVAAAASLGKLGENPPGMVEALIAGLRNAHS